MSTSDVITKGFIRQWGSCNLNGKETRLNESCWAYKEVSLNQLNRRKQNGLIEEV